MDHRELTVHSGGAEIGPPRALPAMEAGMAGGQEYISLASYWNTLLKRRWTVVSIALIVLTITAIVSFKMRPVYRATARVQVDTETPLIQSIEELYQKSDADDTFVQTQIQILKSENLAWRTIQQLGMTDSLIKPDKLQAIPESQRKIHLLDQFKRNLVVELTPKTRMLSVSYEASNPQLAAQVATSLVNNYIDYSFRLKYEATRQASAWMEQQLDELKAKVESSQQALVAYEQENQIANTGEKQNVQEQMLSDLGRELSVAESDRVQKESLYRETQANPKQTAFLAHNDLLQKMEERAAELQGQYAETVAQYGPKYPKALRIQDQIDDIHAQIEREQQRVNDRIKKDYQTAVAREKLATAAMAAQRDKVGKQNQLLVQHNILQREFESNQQLYQSLLQRLKNATVSAGLQSTNIHLVDAALPPTEPIRPRKTLNLGLGLLAGIVLGVMGAFVQEGLDHSIRSAEEVENLLFVPTLAVIPLERSTDPDRKMLRLPRTSAVGSSSEVALTISEKPQSVLSEAYRALRTSVLLSLSPNPPKTILVTSSQSGEGKTATASNLAQSMAQRKGKVLLIDCDLRKGGVARLLDAPTDKGLSTVLEGGCTAEQALYQYPKNSNLWILPAGPTPPNPAELVGSDTMAVVLSELASKFDHIIIDSPPVLAVTDATILSGIVDGVVLVVESGRTHRMGLMRTRAILENAGARILGSVLNKLDMREEGYYGYYGYYYSRYGYKRYPYANAE